MFIFTLFEVIGQTDVDHFTLSGRVLDNSTLKPIPAVHIFTNRNGSYSDFDGNFKIRVRVGDTLEISHITYENQTIFLKPSQSSIKIYLKKEAQYLKPLTIFRWQGVEEFKLQVLEKVIYDQELQNAKLNFDLISFQFFYGETPVMDSFDNFKSHSKGPQDFTIFSTGSNKGLMRAIRNKRLGIGFKPK